MKERVCGCHFHNGLLLSPEGLAQRKDSFGGNLEMFPEYTEQVGVSGSGLELERDLYAFISDSEIDEQARRFHHGC